jgi:hypothetical protein
MSIDVDRKNHPLKAISLEVRPLHIELEWLQERFSDCRTLSVHAE